MARKHERAAGGGGRLRRVAEAVSRVFGRRGGDEADSSDQTAFDSTEEARTAAPAARPVNRRTDIPLDVIDRTYTPPRTSSKASFRSDGADHQLDQEFAFGVADERWNDEDRYTNRSGDPRIGTRGRTYEPREQKRRTNE